MAAEKRWRIFGDGETNRGYVYGPDTEGELKVIAADSPQVLSVEEAREILKAAFTEDPDLDVLDAVLSRIGEWAESKESDRG